MTEPLNELNCECHRGLREQVTDVLGDADAFSPEATCQAILAAYAHAYPGRFISTTVAPERDAVWVRLPLAVAQAEAARMANEAEA